MSHRNAPLTPTGRLRLARCIVVDRWPLRRAADRYGVSVPTAQRWAGRYRQHGKAGMLDRSSRPHHSPTQLDTHTERRILGLRVSRRWGPERIAYRLRLNPSTVHNVLRRYHAPPLAWTDPATGVRLRAKPTPQRYEHQAPGDLVHVDIKKLGRIPNGGGHRVHGRAKANRIDKGAKPGTAYVHNAMDDHPGSPTARSWHEKERDRLRVLGTRQIKVRADPGDFGLGDPGVGAEGLNQVVDLPGRDSVQVASITTANSAWPTRRRRSNSDGKYDPHRSFGIRSSKSPVLVENVLDRDPWR